MYIVWFPIVIILVLQSLSNIGKRMKFNTIKHLAIAFVILLPSLIQADDWARWRGPTGNGIADKSQKPPTEWADDKNVVWKVKVPGRGHASPIVIGDKIFLATAEDAKQTQSVVCFNRKDGELLWHTEVNSGGFPGKIFPKNTHASSTVATNGKLIFAVFNNHDGVQLVALDFNGKKIWEERVGEYDPFYKFGFGSSPIYYQGNVLVTNENKVKSSVVAFNADTGKRNWSIDRSGISSYSTPVITKVAGEMRMLLSGGRKINSYDPTTGELQWSAPASWQVTCGTMVWDGDLVFASGGFPSKHTLAIDAKTGEKVWENRVKVYEQSMLAVDGYVYAHSDNSAVYCWRASDGKEMWKQRFKAPVSVSPVLAGGNIYFTAENGASLVVKANPEKLEIVSENQLGTSAFATPAFCGNRIYTRVGQEENGSRQEWLYCLGKK